MSNKEKPSKTAELVAAARVALARSADPPVFVDEYASDLCGFLWRTIANSKFLTWFVLDVQLAPIKPVVVNVPVRAAYGEDRAVPILKSGVDQHVILGAGYDSFAMRHVDLQESVTVFEIDQAVTQNLKLMRMQKKGIEKPTNARYIAADLNKDSMFDLLNQHGFNQNKPAVFSWFGVTYYLPFSSIQKTLKMVTSHSAPGSSILFDVYYEVKSLPKEWQHSIAQLAEFVSKKGEPMKSNFHPERVSEFVLNCGFSSIEVFTPDDINREYLSNRKDKLKFPPFAAYCHAFV